MFGVPVIHPFVVLYVNPIPLGPNVGWSPLMLTVIVSIASPLQMVWFLLAERVTLGDGFTVTAQVVVADPQLGLGLVVVMVMVPPSLGMPLISFVSSLKVKPEGSDMVTLPPEVVTVIGVMALPEHTVTLFSERVAEGAGITVMVPLAVAGAQSY